MNSARDPQDDLQRWCADAGWVHALARKLVADAALADDVAQEAWVRALRGPRPAPASFRSWVAAVLRNLVTAHWRGDARRVHHERRADAPQATEDPAAALARLEAHDLLIAAVRQLEEPYRTTIVLRWLEGLSPRAIAARTATPLRTVHTRLQRGMAQLRARLHDRDARWCALLVPMVTSGRTAAALLLMTTKTKFGLLAGLGAAAVLALVWPLLPATPQAAAGGASNHVVAAVAEAARRESARSEGPPTERVAVPPSATPANAAAAPEAWSLVGNVVDLDARPLVGVAVAFTGFGHDKPGERARSGGDGSFALTLAAVKGGNLDVDDPAWTTVYRPVLWGNRDVGELTLVAAPAARVSGIVVDQAGRPLAGAKIAVSGTVPPRAAFGRSLERALDGEWQATTGAEGTFELPRAPVLPGMRIRAALAGHRTEDSELVARENVRLVLTTIGSLLTGQVLLADGRPTAAAVFCGAAAAMAGDDGRFTIDIANAGRDPARHTERWLIASRNGLLPARLRCDRDPPSDPASWPQPLELRFERSALSIDGRALFADGTPVPSPSVRILDPEYLGDASDARGNEMASVEFQARVHSHVGDGGTQFWESGSLPMGTTTGGGHFVVGGLQDRAYHLLLEEPSTLQWSVSGPVRGGAHGVELRLPAEGLWPRIAGTVVDRRGAPVAGAAVWLERDAPPDATFAFAAGGAPSAKPSSTTAQLTTDAQGRFERGPLTCAARTILVQTPGIADATRLALAACGPTADLRVVAPVSTKVRIVATAATREADSAAFLVADGGKIAATITHGNQAWGAKDVALVDGQSEVVVVPDDAVTLVLFKQGKETLRLPVALTPERLHELRP